MGVYAKTALTVIAVCLVLQVAQGFGLGATPESGQAESSNSDRYVVQVIPMARVLLRIDRATGRTWTMPLQRDMKMAWTLVDESPSEPMVREEGEGAPPLPDKRVEAGE